MRTVRRQMARAQQREKEALQAHVLREYGPETKLADTHPDVQYLFAACFALAEAFFGEDETVQAEAIARVISIVSRYGDQVADV